MKQYYNSEIEGMIDFYLTLGLEDKVDYECNTDGAINGCLFEFKLNFQDLLAHKNQVKRYLLSYNSIAKKIPAKTVLIDINNRRYIEGDISTTSSGVTITWSEIDEHWSTPHELTKFTNLDKYCPGWIDEFSIVSYNNLFCQINNIKTTSKEAVQNEFIKPKILFIHSFDWHAQLRLEKQLKGNTQWLTFNMNMLGSKALKKQLGAFFTPNKYVRISTQYVRNAIKNVPEGMDYVVIDRCAGSGNLEKFFTDDELSHFILNTIDYTEWTTLKGLYDGRVRYIIPHDSRSRNINTGLMKDGDALSKEFYDNLLPFIEGKYIIMLENPPFADVGGNSGGHKAAEMIYDGNGKSYINNEMIKKVGGNLCNERGHQFIWSAWEHIKPNEYILFSPIKYWKLYNLSNKKIVNGCVCNSLKFNADNEFSVGLIHWINEEDYLDELQLNIEDTSQILTIKKCKTLFEYDKRKYPGSPIARVRAEGFMLGNSNVYLSNFDTGTTIWKRSKNFYSQNALTVLPLFCAKLKHYHYNDWTEKVVICNSFDGKGSYLNDIDFQTNCFIYTCLTDYNKCISNQSVTNELCLLQNTLADSICANLKLDSYALHLIELWQDVLDEIRRGNKVEFNNKYKYGLYQINKEINLKIPSASLKKTREPIMVSKYPYLDEKNKALKDALKDFFHKKLEPKFFEHQLLK